MTAIPLHPFLITAIKQQKHTPVCLVSAPDLASAKQQIHDDDIAMVFGIEVDTLQAHTLTTAALQVELTDHALTATPEGHMMTMCNYRPQRIVDFDEVSIGTEAFMKAMNL